MRVFAAGFLQIPPHGGHPCLWLTVPTTKSVADFHRQVVTHIGRTKKENVVFTLHPLYIPINTS